MSPSLLALYNNFTLLSFPINSCNNFFSSSVIKSNKKSFFSLTHLSENFVIVAKLIVKLSVTESFSSFIDIFLSLYNFSISLNDSETLSFILKNFETLIKSVNE